MPIPSGPPTQRRLLARDRAYESLKDAIMRGVLLPGERLDDSDLQAWLGLSRTPIRQALYALTLEGLVETAPQAFTRVVEPDPADAVDYMQTIGVLVIGHMELTLPTAASSDLAALGTSLAAVRKALQHEDLPAAITAAEQYHLALIELCQNRALRQLSAQAGPFLGYYVATVSASLPIDWAHLADEYRLLETAVVNRDVPDAIDVAKRLFSIVR